MVIIDDIYTDEPAGEPIEQDNELPAENSLELFEKVLINTDFSGIKFEELKSYIATAYLERNELMAIRKMHGVLSNIDYIINIIVNNLKGEIVEEKEELEKELKKHVQMRDVLLRKMFFMAYSSKSKNGFVVRELNSQHSYRHENLYQRQSFDEEEQNFLSNISQKLKKLQKKGGAKKVWPERKEMW